MRPTCPLCRQPMSEAEAPPFGFGGEGPRYVCRSPGCISNSLGADGATWIGGVPRQQSAGTEVLGAAPAREEPLFASSSSSSTTWLGAPAPSFAAEPPPRRSALADRPSSSSATSNGHEFEDGVCLHCGRVERLAGRYGWSCPVRLP